MCSNQASVPNSLPPLYMIDRFTSFRPASMDEILLKTAFCTENQCPGMPEQCPNVPGHARTMPEAPPHVPRACQNVPEPCPHAFQTTSGVVCTQVWTNYPRGRLIPLESGDRPWPGPLFRRRPCRGPSRHKRTGAGSRFPRSAYHKSNDSASAAPHPDRGTAATAAAKTIVISLFACL